MDIQVAMSSNVHLIEDLTSGTWAALNHVYLIRYQDTPDGACKGEGKSRHHHIACAEEQVDSEEDGQVMNDVAPCLRWEGWLIK